MKRAASRRDPGVVAAVVGGLALLGATACAPTQRIPLQAEPRPLALYVDGELQGTIPDEIELRADRDHTLYFKKSGYRSELVVLESTRDDGTKRLSPDRVRVTLRPRGSTAGEVEIERAPAPEREEGR